MNIALRVIIDLFIVGGCFFAFAGAVGIVRMPDTFSRMQSSTNITTLGILLTLIGALLYFIFVVHSWGSAAKVVIIGVLTVEYTLHGNDSLKGKRRVANSLKQKVRNTFNVAIAEAGTEDSLVRLRLTVVSISNSERHLQSRMDKCLAMMEAVCDEEMTWSDLEMMDAD